MPNVCLVVCLAVLFSFCGIGGAPVWGQVRFGNAAHPYDPSRNRFGYPDWDPVPILPPSAQPAPVGPATVSSDMLRHPPSAKARRLFGKAMRQAKLGNHPAAIEGLREALIKCPADAPYTENLLGLEYIEIRRLTDAKDSFEEAARMMPRESSNHSNFGLSLAMLGEWDSAEKEVRKALELDRTNDKAKEILQAVLIHKRNQSAEPRP